MIKLYKILLEIQVTRPYILSDSAKQFIKDINEMRRLSQIYPELINFDKIDESVESVHVVNLTLGFDNNLDNKISKQGFIDNIDKHMDIPEEESSEWWDEYIKKGWIK